LFVILFLVFNNSIQGILYLWKDLAPAANTLTQEHHANCFHVGNVAILVAWTEVDIRKMDALMQTGCKKTQAVRLVVSNGPHLWNIFNFLRLTKKPSLFYTATAFFCHKNTREIAARH